MKPLDAFKLYKWPTEAFRELGWYTSLTKIRELIELDSNNLFKRLLN